MFAAVGVLASQRDVELSKILHVEREVARLEELRQTDPTAFEAESELYTALVAENTKNRQFQSQMSTTGLLFKTYPAILTRIGPVAGKVFGVLFFASLVMAGISSSISILEAFMAALNDQFGWTRSRIATVLCFVAFLLGVVFCTQAGLFWLDLVDHFITTYGLVIVGICEALIVGWLFPAKRLRSHLDEYRDFQFGKVFAVVMRLLITVMLLLTWYGLSQTDDVPVMSGLARCALLASVLVLWMNEHWLDFDIRLAIPALLVFLLDQALVNEVSANYGGYSRGAILTIGVTWFAMTLVVGIVLSWFSAGSNPSNPDTE